MSTRLPKPRIFASLAAAALSLSLIACQTADPPPAETVLHLHLSDTLNHYDKVEVLLLDGEDSGAVLATLYNDVMRNPGSDVPPYPLKGLAEGPFTVKVRGYLALGQLALETHIVYKDGKKKVRYTALPPIKPPNWLVKLAPSAGAVMSPPFHKDSLNYIVSVPENSGPITFAQQAAHAGAKVSFDGETLAFGAASKAFTVGTSAQTIRVLVTDASTGVASTRQYNLTLVQSLPPGLTLATLKPSAGTLDREFKPEDQVYDLTLPPGMDTVSFVVTSTDPRTLITIDGKAIFSGSKSEVFHVTFSSFAIPINVSRGSQTSFYQIIVNLSGP